MGKVTFVGGKVGMIAPSRPSRLPIGYTELKYIQSSGAQFINTGVTIPENGEPWSIESVIYQYTDRTTDTFFTVKADVPKTARSELFGYRYNNLIVMGIYAAVQIGFDGDFTKINRVVVDFANDVATITYDGESTSTTNTSGTWRDGTFLIAQGYSFDHYAYKIYTQNVLVRDYVPCISPDNEVGMYDLVNSKFYGNSGTGVFIGSEV